MGPRRMCERGGGVLPEYTESGGNGGGPGRHNPEAGKAGPCRKGLLTNGVLPGLM